MSGGVVRSVMAALRAWCAAAVLASAPGCSYAFVQEAPRHHTQLRHFECTSSRVLPVMDTIGGGGAVVVAVANTVSPASYESSEDTLLQVGLALVAATAFAFSAGYGYVHTNECEAAKLGLMRRLASEPPAAPAQAPGCSSDMECKGDRICVARACVEPVPAAPTTEPSPIAPTTEPAPAKP